MNIIFPFAEPMRVRRMSGQGGYDSQGMFVPGTYQTFTITASVQPLNGREMQFLSEGTRNRETFKVYTDMKLRPVSERGSQSADRVEINGEWFEVISVIDWSHHLALTHYKVIVQRDNRNDEADMGKMKEVT